MTDVKVEPTDTDDLEFTYGYRICNLLKRDFEKLEEDQNRDSVKIKLYVNQAEMINLAKILFWNDVKFPMSPQCPVVIIKNYYN